MKISVLGSGSTGNSVLLVANGTRVLVDRLWPPGLSKDDAAVDAWLRDLAPSDGLRQWFHARPEAWAGFRKRYIKELSRPEAEKALDELYRLGGRFADLAKAQFMGTDEKMLLSK